MEAVEDLKELVALSRLKRNGACGNKCGYPLENGLWITARKEMDTLTLQFCKEKDWKQVFIPSQPSDSNGHLDFSLVITV